MTHAIVGSGAIGSALAGQFARKNMDVYLANRRGPASLTELVRKLGANVTATSVEEALRADVVILAVPFDVIPDIVGNHSDWGGRIIVDASNAIEFPAFKPADLGGRLSTDIVAAAVPGASVVKAFNTIPAAILAMDPAEHGGHRVVFHSSNDQAANANIAKLIEALGFAPINLGKLSEGGRLQQFGAALVAVNLIRLT